MNSVATGRQRNQHPQRHGSILLEVSVAAFIVALAVASSSQYLTNALNASDRIQRITRATLMCETRIAEALAQNRDAVTPQEGFFEFNPEWRWKQLVDSGPFPSVGRVTVLVFFGADSAPVCSLTRLFPIRREKSAASPRGP